MPLLSIENICKKYPQSEKYALLDISFKVPEGEILALIGESGSGKTSFLRILAGLEHPQKGTIHHGDITFLDSKKSLPSHQRNLGMVFQDYALFPQLSVLENVKSGINQKSRANQKALETLKKMGLEGLKNKFPHQLSGGQQQRVALARALVSEPQILILDEPFRNLDSLLKEQISEELMEIIKEISLTVIFATQDSKDALSMADKIAVLHQGRLLQLDSPARIYDQPANPYVTNMIGKMNEIIATPTEDGFYSSFGFIADPESQNYSEKVRITFRPEHAKIKKSQEQPLNGKLFRTAFFGDHQVVKLMDEEGKIIDIKAAPHRSFQENDRLFFTLNKYHIEEAF
ncbi:ABC transporter ATP-binding protein [Echinicola jeungdonensis]|uniref:ABC transporter ATP-binding protein n=1 Tax=Echinicola jeungdonensis TaxID=709343 RepID=A0ABV5J781_9BACT|nr:ABC transporter ATP-binding protein [Echinicola jeungdonensis]MDN3669167.1 ABC transporter ATP-binding protein [Echinicola jeungdonensis]